MDCYPIAPTVWIIITPFILIVIHKIDVRVFHRSVKRIKDNQLIDNNYQLLILDFYLIDNLRSIS